MAKKTERKKLDEQCLALFSLCVRARQKTCRNCNADYNLQAHHIVQRTYKLSRYNHASNGLCLCRGCHYMEKTDAEKFRNMVIGIVGILRYEELQDGYRVRYKWSVADLKDIRKGLKYELSIIEKDWGVPFDPLDIPF